MIGLAAVTAILLVLSFFSDRCKTMAGLKKGAKMFLNILPALLTVLILVSVFLYAVPDRVLTEWLGKGTGWAGIVSAALLGSISLIPGFIAFPLGAILVRSGVSYQVIAVFITTLMMVGILTLPLEAKYFGWRVSILRNLLSFFGALLIGLLMGIFL
ncbi:MAG: hypothetical protein NTW95_13235 [Candidatus Aminicenantes bacterium]|nr:hypothetical protein [Candidatus Aminicenantes bacterium]